MSSKQAKLLRPFNLNNLELQNRIVMAPMTLAHFRKVFSGPLVGNCGYTLETAERAIAQIPDFLVAFGRPFISNPDLVERFANNWPLNPEADMSTWYNPTGAEGYVDFPIAQEADLKN